MRGVCTRYISPEAGDIERHWHVGARTPASWPRELFPRYRGPFVRAARQATAPQRELVVGQWALVPWFATTPTLPYLTVNARFEEIAAKAEVSKPVVYEHFGGKEGLYAVVVEREMNRLLTMTNEEGGLAYWPGGQEPSLWGTAYGGFMLMRARDAGASVPPEVIDKITAYLSKRLRGLEEEKDVIRDRVTHF